METPLDLYRARRDELIAVILRQREQIADLEREQAQLQAALAAQRTALEQLQTRVGTLLALLDPADDDAPARPATMPGLKPTARRPASASPRPPRKRRARGYGRKRMRPTARQL